MRNRKATALIVIGAVSAVAGPAHAITFVMNFAAGTSAEAQAGFNAAAATWSNLLADPITVRLDVGTEAMQGSVLGFANSTKNFKTYTQVRNGMIAGPQSADDVQAISTLAATSTFQAWTNRFTDNPAGAANSSLFSTNLANMWISTANAKALGIFTGSASANDALIRFNSNFAFDYDRSNGIDPTQIDFIGVATHEIGHALGFLSGVDYVDSTPDDSSTELPWANTLDLFRYSSAGTRNLAAGTGDKYLSIDGGISNPSILFSTGVNLGDGRQASHFKDNLGIGIMDPTTAFGELVAITQNDLRALDVIGYEVVPEPASMAALGLGVLALARRRKKS